MSQPPSDSDQIKYIEMVAESYGILNCTSTVDFVPPTLVPDELRAAALGWSFAVMQQAISK